MTFGTSHFVSIRAAERYYASYGYDRTDVAAKIKAGEIHIGEPDYKAGEKITIKEGRYHLTEAA